MNVSTRVVESETDRAQVATLVAEYESSLPTDLRHDAVPEADGTAGVAILAVSSGVPSGCVFVSHHDDEAAVIQRLYVRPAARGHGVARKLMQHAADRARALGYRRLVLDTDKDQLQGAYQLYLSLGFTPCPPYGSVSYANPTYMELLLSS
jgi:GNAT superfamily N-acetyltransferase